MGATLWAYAVEDESPLGRAGVTVPVERNGRQERLLGAQLVERARIGAVRPAMDLERGAHAVGGGLLAQLLDRVAAEARQRLVRGLRDQQSEGEHRAGG